MGGSGLSVNQKAVGLLGKNWMERVNVKENCQGVGAKIALGSAGFVVLDHYHRPRIGLGRVFNSGFQRALRAFQYSDRTGCIQRSLYGRSAENGLQTSASRGHSPWRVCDHCHALWAGVETATLWLTAEECTRARRALSGQLPRSANWHKTKARIRLDPRMPHS